MDADHRRHQPASPLQGAADPGSSAPGSWPTASEATAYAGGASG